MAIVKGNMEKMYRAFGIGATCLVSAEFNKDTDIMAAAWNCALDLVPFKASVVVAKDHYTRSLIEKSGYFALQLPKVKIADTVMYLGSISKNDNKNKLEESKVETFFVDGFDIPLVKDCFAYVIFKVLKDSPLQYDLILGEAVACYVDDSCFKDGHFTYNKDTDDAEKPLHYVAGGHFYTLGNEIFLKEYGDD